MRGLQTPPVYRGIKARKIIMVLTLDGNSEIGAHVWNNLGYLISLRHQPEFYFFPQKRWGHFFSNN